jgi:hypothetical protein
VVLEVAGYTAMDNGTAHRVFRCERAKVTSGNLDGLLSKALLRGNLAILKGLVGGMGFEALNR